MSEFRVHLLILSLAFKVFVDTMVTAAEGPDCVIWLYEKEAQFGFQAKFHGPILLH